MGKHVAESNEPDWLDILRLRLGPVLFQVVTDAFTALDNEIEELKALRTADAQAVADAVNQRVATLQAERTAEAAADAPATPPATDPTAPAAGDTAATDAAAAETAATGFDVTSTAVHQ